MHTRRIECSGYHRTDGLWDIEARMTDEKHYEISTRERSLIAPDERLHDMWLRLTVDDSLTVVDVLASTDAAPFVQSCAEVNPRYGRMKGVRIAPGWTRTVAERLGGVEGCTHLNELLKAMATVAIQTVGYYHYLRPQGDAPAPSRGALHPALINSCHSYSTQGETVRKYWPLQYDGQAVQEPAASQLARGEQE
jgi:hypothetical protein